MPPTGFEPTIPASELSQTHVLDSAATSVGRTNEAELRYNVIKWTDYFLPL